MQFRDILHKIARRQDLSRQEAREAFEHLMSGNASEAQIGGLLVGLAAKGTTVEELVGAALVMREKVIPVDFDPAGKVVLDTCGTGGDVRHTVNVSTVAALIAASCGVTVVKHGNRSASGSAGSADVLEKLGLNLEANQTQLGNCLAHANICFAFARKHHPAMKFVAEARKSLGIPTIFNLLGPITNPGRVRHQLLGVYAREQTDRLAKVLLELGSQRAWVVHADDGLDELSTLGPTHICEVQNGRINPWTLNPTNLGIPLARLEDLQVSGVDQAAHALLAVLQGEKSPQRDISLLNAAGALVVAGLAADLTQGLDLAAKAIDSGRAKQALDELIRYSKAG